MEKKPEHKLGPYAQAIKEYIEKTLDHTYNETEYNEKWYGENGIITLYKKEN